MLAPSLDAVDAELARRRLRRFIEMAWPVVEPGTPYLHHWLVDTLCEYLEAATRREIRRLIINIPPRTIKSRAVSVMWPAWVWLTQPHTRWLFASYANDLAIEHSVDCRSIIESGGGLERGELIERIGYRGLLSLIGQDWTLTDDQNLKTRFKNTAGGYRFATSVGSKVTGFGGDFIVVDDPHNAKETESDVVREAALHWWDRSMSTRLNDPKTGVRVVVMQRLHEADLTGHLLAKDAGYEHLCLPMRYEPKHPFVWPRDPRVEEGDLLWPERFDEPELEDLLKHLGPYGYAGQMQQRPSPAEGGIFERQWWQFYPEGKEPPAKSMWTTWDTALREKTSNDYTVGIAWLQDLENRYVLRIVRGRWSLVETLAQMQALHDWLTAKHPEGGTPTHYVENAAMGPELIAAARRAMPGIVPMFADKDKEARARSVTPFLAGGNVWLPANPVTFEPTGMAAALIEECSAFPNGLHDDQVDALVYGITPLRWAPGGSKPKREGRRPVTAALSARDV